MLMTLVKIMESLKKMGWEVGDRSYSNPAINMTNKCWLDKARNDFIANNPGKPIPSKYILIGHSMGGTSNNVHRVSLSGMW